MSKPITAKQLKAAFEKWGVPAQYLDGFEKRGRPSTTAGGPFVDVKGIMIHHTASESQTMQYVNWLFKVGRADLPAPLCQFATNKQGLTYVGALGKANHAGLGSQSNHTLVMNESYDGYNKELKGGNKFNGNAYYYGNEVMYYGANGYKMTSAQYDGVVRFCAALCDHYKWTPLSIIGHREWSSTKIDPGYIFMYNLRKDVRELLLSKNPITKPPVQTPEPTTSYVVEKGDTLWGISKKFKTSVPEIRRINELKTDIISVGQVLKLVGGDVSPVEPPVPSVLDKMNPKNYFKGVVGPHVKWLGDRLIVHGFGDVYEVGSGPNFGPADQEGVKNFQEAQGWRGSDADGFPGNESLKRLAATPKTPATQDATSFLSWNLAAYNASYGMGNRVGRVPKLAKVINREEPSIVCLQEISSDMLKPMDEKLANYRRAPLGDKSGKGRQIYVHKKRGIRIIAAEVQNVKHMLKRDTKEFVLVAFERNGKKGVAVSFHNENQGKTVQKSQMKDVLNAAIKFANKHKVKYANIVVAGDANRKEVGADVRPWNWRAAEALSGLVQNIQFHSTNGWRGSKTLGRKIDWILVRYNAHVVRYEQIFEDEYNKESDHYAQLAVVVLQ